MQRHARLGNRLTAVCWRRRVTDDELAERAGVSRAHLTRIRNGRVVPRLGTALALATVLRCRIRELFYLRHRSRAGPHRRGT